MTDRSGLTNTARRYGSVAKTLHWLIALLILTEIALGLIANDWAYGSSDALATKGTLFSLHKTIGVTIFFLALLRIVWALRQIKPVPLHPDRRAETWAAETVHWLLYGALVLMPLSGWISHAASSGFAPVWWPFGQSLPFVPKDEAVADLFGGLHEIFSKVLIAAVALHIAGALKHQFIDKDATLRRMWFGTTSGGDMVPGPKAQSPLWSALTIYAAALCLGFGLSLFQPIAAPDPGAPSALSETPSGAGWSVQSGTLGFSVQQFGEPVEGQFNNWTAAINFDPEAPGEIKGDVDVEIDISSLTLGSVTEEALKPPFFDAQAHPTARFSGDIREDESGAYVVEGTLDLKGNQQPLSLPFTLDLEGDIATMRGETVINRTAFAIGTAQYGDEKTIGFDVATTVNLTARRSR